MAVRAASALILLLAGACASAPAQVFDPRSSRIEFDVRTRAGVPARGHFPGFQGRVDTLPDGRRQVHLRLPVGQMRMAGPDRYTQVARGPGMFDAARHPWIEFVSDPYDEALSRRGGPLPGRLRMRGVERREVFTLVPATCARPGHGCPVLAEGRVSRDDYGLQGWRWMLADRVRFRLHARFADS